MLLKNLKSYYLTVEQTESSKAYLKSMVYDRKDSSCNLCASHVKECANLDRQWRKPKEIFKRAQWFSSQY